MFVPKRMSVALSHAGTLCVMALVIAPATAQQRYGLGQPLSAREIAGWNIDVKADGTGLPAGRGTSAEGAVLYAHECASCHGAAGGGKPANRLVGGIGTLASAHPVKTVGSYWPYATTLFDYIRRAMPREAPQSLKDDEVYALTAYILLLNGIIPADAEMNASTLPEVEMPNRNGFRPVVD